MTYRYLIYALISLCPGWLMAQQTQLFSQHMFNRAYVNPAHTGLADAIEVSAFYRSQWVGLAGSPEYQTITAGIPLWDINSGAGITFYNDQLGVERNTAIYGQYAYHKSVKKATISVGARVGWVQKSFDGSRLTTPGGQYTDNTVIVHNDGIIPAIDVSGGAPDISIGVQYQGAGYYIGLVADQLIGNTLRLQAAGTSPAVSLQRTITATGGYSFPVSSSLTLASNVLVRTDFVKHQLDISLIATYNRIISAGIGYRGYNSRSTDAIIAMLGAELSQRWMFGYAYDYNISALGDVNAGTHELFVQYRLPLVRPRVGKVINNPRFLSF